MKHKTRTKALSWLLSLALALSLMPGMSLTAQAGEANPYAALLNTTTVVKFDNKDWYLIENNSTALNAGTVTLLSKECVAASKYNSFFYVEYASSTVKTAVDNYYTNSISSNVKTAIVDAKMFLLTKDQANAMTAATRKCTKASGADENAWWLRSPGGDDECAACVLANLGSVYGDGESVSYTLGVRPALKLDLSKVTFDSASKTFSVSAAAQKASADIRAKIEYLFTQFDYEYLIALIEGSSVDEYPVRNAVSAKFNGEDADITYSQTSDCSADVTISHGGTELRFSVSIETDAETDDRITVVGQVTYTGDEPTDFSLTYQAPGAVTGVTLNKTETQTVAVDGSVALTATVAPEDAADKTVVWSVGGANAGAVKLYSDEACNNEVGAEATETLTVYAKGVSAGTATVTATSNADSTKSASCDVTVNEAQPSTYILTIPSTLTVANSGWNATDGISATGTLAEGKKLTVTASSANSWALKQQDGNETVSYTMKETSDGAAKTAWEFTALPGSATLGIDVADYSNKPAGTYQDTVTFTAKVAASARTFCIVAGNESAIFGSAWDGSYEANLMDFENNVYTKTYKVSGAYDSVELKVVKNGTEWIGDQNGDNVRFKLTGSGLFTVTYDPETGYVTVSGDSVSFGTNFEYNTVYVVGNGEGNWLNGATWDLGNDENEMTEVAQDVWEIEFQDVPKGFDCMVKFAIDGEWTHIFGGTFGNSGTETAAVYNGGNIQFVTEEGCTVTLRLDLSGYDDTTKEGAVFTVIFTYS